MGGPAGQTVCVAAGEPAVLEVIRKEAEALGVKPRELKDDDILNRHVFALVNEGMNILQEGIAQRPGDIDVVYVYL